MQLSNSQIQKFKELYKKEFPERKELSDKKATICALQVIEITKLIYKPIKKSWIKKIND
jgi:hypothetical protein